MARLLKRAFAPKRRIYTISSIVVCAFGLLVSLYMSDRYLLAQYRALESHITKDRNGIVLTVLPNSKQVYAQYADTFPPRVLDFLVRKEDRFFYVHPGVNPLSTLRAAFRYVSGKNSGGASTITQQLVKNLLGHEQNRSLGNKFVELFGAFALELFNSKNTILNMYANSVYMGNQVQGLDTAASLYFGKDLRDLDDTKLAMLLSTISSPSVQNPWNEENARTSRNLALALGVSYEPKLATVTDVHEYKPARNFELSAMHKTCNENCTTTIDADLTDHVRKILAKYVDLNWAAGARSGAVVVLKLPENQILAFVGTPDVNGLEEGQQIDMAVEPRPIGSTAKPFIYLQGFEKGLRPYTLVNDREYKFPIGSGFSLYPKNYDGKYRGWITLHSALSNSLNVPTVQVLKYVGLSDFYGFLENSLGFQPLRDLDEYQYGIALGALDMDPLTLAYFLSLFPNHGQLRPLQLFQDGQMPFIKAPMSNVTLEKKVASPQFSQLVTKVLNDRLTGVEQFGLSSSLNLSQSNYAVKTGTSQDYHDSWTVGFTPDFLVVVWFGNPDNTALKHVTGQSGAGAIWHDTMELLLNSSYNKKTPLDFSHVQTFHIQNGIDFGLEGDVVADHRDLLPDGDLITSPQEGDTFLQETNTSIPLIAAENVSWYANGMYIGSGARLNFLPKTPDDYAIRAVDSAGRSQIVHVHVIVRQ